MHPLVTRHKHTHTHQVKPSQCFVVEHVHVYIKQGVGGKYTECIYCVAFDVSQKNEFSLFIHRFKFNVKEKGYTMVQNRVPA